MCFLSPIRLYSISYACWLNILLYLLKDFLYLKKILLLFFLLRSVFSYGYVEFLVCSDYESVLVGWYCNIFHQPMGCFFTHLMVSFNTLKPWLRSTFARVRKILFCFIVVSFIFISIFHKDGLCHMDGLSIIFSHRHPQFSSDFFKLYADFIKWLWISPSGNI